MQVMGAENVTGTAKEEAQEAMEVIQAGRVPGLVHRGGQVL